MKKTKPLALALACAFVCCVGTACGGGSGSNNSDPAGNNTDPTLPGTEDPNEDTPKTPYMQVTSEQWNELTHFAFINLTFRTVGWQASTKDEIDDPESKIQETIMKYDASNYRVELRMEQGGVVSQWRIHTKEGDKWYSYKYLLDSQSWSRSIDTVDEDGIGLGYRYDYGLYSYSISFGPTLGSFDEYTFDEETGSYVGKGIYKDVEVEKVVRFEHNRMVYHSIEGNFGGKYTKSEVYFYDYESTVITPPTEYTVA